MGGWRIPFNRPSLVGNELSYMERAARGEERVGGGSYTDAARRLLRGSTGAVDVLLTTSCTSALELSALMLDLEPGDAVIVPSFTFVTTGLAFARAGARLRFADIEPTTLGIDPDSVAELMDEAVRAVVPINYAGVACDLPGLDRVVEGSGASIVGDNAHGLFGALDGVPLTAHGRFSALSFHSTKNFTCGEGGALVINRREDVARARVLYDKGTNRGAFLAGEVSNYSWVDTGSSFALADVLAAQLLGQLEERDRVLERRRGIWQRYERLLLPFEDQLGIGVMRIPAGRSVADHMFYVLCEDREQRGRALAGLAAVGIQATSHYVPLHSSLGARRFVDDRVGPRPCPVTADVSGRLMRLPFFNELTDPEIDEVVEQLVKVLSR